VCPAFLQHATFYQLLLRIDVSIADTLRQQGCACGGTLHSARYPRKPRGIRSALGPAYESRLSFCCHRDGCRRRHTPASVRFLGRKAYLGVIVVLLTALSHGLTPKRRTLLIERLQVPPQTLSRWRRWWREYFTASRCWRALARAFLPPLDTQALPGSLLGGITGESLAERLVKVLVLIAPISTSPGSLRAASCPQKM
jgi:hypothetical protein